MALFDRAAGCQAAGQTSDEASWFSGYTWQRAFCRKCSTHVGWLYRSKTGSFYGILRRDEVTGPDHHRVLGLRSSD